ncbi:purine-cytosine permease family protein [Janibacter limosus]|uniref:purine-cytosine permease family protein n=1 Tax=Janibacter limosus TaxID=53458 RepID=UPI00082987A7|nr:cytosine permease [Janibacter limosus]
MAANRPVDSPPSALSVEPYGIDTIPDEARTATPRDLFRIIFGASNSIATMVLGSLPIIFGLGVVDGALAIVVGVMVGSLLLAPMALFGPVNGTNNPISSGAHFGVVGRVLGSLLGLLTAVTFTALAVWASGDAMVAAAHRLFGLPDSGVAAAAAYAIVGLVVLLVVVFGFRLMLLVNRIAVIGVTAMMLVGIFAFAGDFDATYAGIFTAEADAATTALYWPTLVGTALIAMSNPISYGPFLGDWSRYIPARTPRRRLLGAVLCSQIATLLPFGFGLATTAIVAAKAPEFADPANPSFVGGLVAVAPGWYLAPLIIISLIGGLSVATGTLYGTGLDFSSILPRFSRIQATLIIGTGTVGLLFMGRFVFDLLAGLSTLASLIVVCTSPWIVIMVLGYITRRGWYLPEDLQVFNRKTTGGIYWFSSGLNWRALGAWAVAAGLGLSVVNIPGQFVGPLGDRFGGFDASLPVSIGVAAIVYLACLTLAPEPAEVYGPQGSNLVKPALRRRSPVGD